MVLESHLTDVLILPKMPKESYKALKVHPHIIKEEWLDVVRLQIVIIIIFVKVKTERIQKTALKTVALLTPVIMI